MSGIWGMYFYTLELSWFAEMFVRKKGEPSYILSLWRTTAYFQPCRPTRGSSLTNERTRCVCTTLSLSSPDVKENRSALAPFLWTPKPSSTSVGVSSLRSHACYVPSNFHPYWAEELISWAEYKWCNLEMGNERCKTLKRGFLCQWAAAHVHTLVVTLS